MSDSSISSNSIRVSLFRTPECELVATLSRRPLGIPGRDRARAIIESGVDWTRIFVLAEYWEVEPVFFENLGRLDCNLPAEISERAQLCGRRARSRATAAALWTVDAIRQVEEAGIPCILLKGAALGVLGYDDLSYRTFADGDILVAKRDLIAATGVLKASGFEPLFRADDAALLIANGHALESVKNGQKVELHWTLFSTHLGLDLVVDDLWSSALSIEIAGRSIRTLDRGSLFFFLCGHGAKHEWERFRWICDIAQLADRLTDADIVRVHDLARRHHAERIVLLAIELAQSLVGSDMTRLRSRPRGDAVALAPAVTRAMLHYEDLANRPASTGPDDFRSRLRALYYWIRMRERLRDRALILGRAFVAPMSASEVPLPGAILHRSARLMRLALGRHER